MNVELIHCTPQAEALIVKMARVSNPSNADNTVTAPKLLRYLIQHEHWSPFEMASLCVKVETERDIAAQILRHRSFSFQEFSTRYARTSIAEIPHFRRQDVKNRQNSMDDLTPEDQERLARDAGEVITKAYGLYYALVDQGVAKETARRILPLCTPTTAWSCNSLMLRAPEYVQDERTPATIWSMMSSTPGRCASRYMRDVLIPSFEKFFAGSINCAFGAGAIAHRAITGHPETLLVQTPLCITHGVGC